MFKMCPLPQPIEVMVQKQNLEFHHTKSHFSYPYFQFMKQLLLINYNYIRVQMEQGPPSTTAVSSSTVLDVYWDILLAIYTTLMRGESSQSIADLVCVMSTSYP